MTEFNRPDRQSATMDVQQTTSPTYQAPAIPGEEYVPPPTAALHVPDGDAFNVDPTTPYLNSGRTGHASPSARSDTSGSRRFLDVFKKAMRPRGSGQQQSPPFATTGSHASAAPPSHTGSVHPDPAFGANGSSPVASSSHTQDSIDFIGHDDEATAVEHEMLPVAQVMGSPVYVEPQPASDYAKMDSPRRSIASFSSYVSRVQKFFSDLNELPWVAERVTVDYVPGESRTRRQARERRAQRPTSWYGDVTNVQPSRHHNVNLFSDTTSSSSLPPTHQTTLPATQYYRYTYSSEPEVIFQIESPNDHSQNIPTAQIVRASFSFNPPAPSPEPPRPVQPPPPTPRPVPPAQPRRAPQPLPPSNPNSNPASTSAQSSPTPAFRPYGETFPLGYVSYPQQAAAAEHYNDLSVHGLSQGAPRPMSSTSGMATHPSRPVSVQPTHTSRPASRAASQMSASPSGTAAPRMASGAASPQPNPPASRTASPHTNAPASRVASPHMSRPTSRTAAATPHPNFATFSAMSPSMHSQSQDFVAASPHVSFPAPAQAGSPYTSRPPSAAATPHTPAAMQYPYPVSTNA
ncbi:hypothetical protein D9615_000642 [Tricholomella constricta]|uniref:Uncharacterized protein n=1 Tax=Tricholomella constricta TaxID=117010 RepID=A0A8H5HR41_9AGAR|nr:hypothetical protein D9615_000642 [Tricholomella constricta]